MEKLLIANASSQLKNIVRGCKISPVHKCCYTNFAYARVLGFNTISSVRNGETSQTKKVNKQAVEIVSSVIQLDHCNE